MIVRISGEDQYRLDDTLHSRLNELDNAVVAAVEARDETAFQATLDAMLGFVRDNGTLVEDDEIETSNVILPPGDTTFAEAEAEFTGEGLIPERD
jgi:hypothetical protein